MTSSRGELTKADTSYSDNPAAPGKPPAAASGFKEIKHINSLVVGGSEVSANRLRLGSAASDAEYRERSRL
jgi:hypothetical protein